ncbi:hypothetical protein [Pseudomonas putida]|uniref:hypothetical protein n=1 Tax=Pseudomonas putida TaxID=303 RepID=UPI002022D06C|nr:hypothetical protein [Pseudomonas putida]MCL8307650.1 hypothetical protein [Pseudomonas putida]
MNIQHAVMEAMTFVALIPGAGQGFDIHDPANRQAAYDFCVDEAFRLAQQCTRAPTPRADMKSLELWQAMCCHATLNEFHRCLKRLQAS